MEPTDPFPIAPWRDAQSKHVLDLAELHLRLGRLDERLRAGPDGWRQRLAVQEASSLSWWVGDRIGLERLSLWRADRIAGPHDDALALSRAGWAARRLMSGIAPLSDPSVFLDRPGQAEAIEGNLQDITPLPDGLHPVTAAARLFHLWRTRPPMSTATAIEAAVLAMRLAGPVERGAGLIFLPIASPAALGLNRSGPITDRLAAWLQGALQATRAALNETERLAAWSDRAQKVLTPKEWRQNQALIGLISASPLVSAPMAESQIDGPSRTTLQRRFAQLEAVGLIREVSGQERYRVWTAELGS